MLTIQIRANGLTFSALSVGTGDQLVLLLHGFPDNARSMVPLMRHLAAAGYWAVAPFMRGYAPTDVAPNDDYSVRALASDAIGIARELSDHPAVLIGHDWGAVAAYVAASLRPERFLSCAALSVPPPAVFPSALYRVPGQLLASQYIAKLASGGAAAAQLSHADGQLIRSLWKQWSPGWPPDSDRIDDVIRTFRRGRTAEAAVKYYRDIFPSFPLHRWQQRVWNGTRAPVRIPTLIFSGDADGCMLPGTFADSLQHIDAYGEHLTLKGVGPAP